MKRHLFLTGPAGFGKSARIRDALGPALAYAGGFVTEYAVDAQGRFLGCDLYPAAAAADFSLYAPQRFLDFSGPTPRKDNEVFRTLGVRLLQEAEYYPYALLDSFGGFELVVPQFWDALTELLKTEKPIIGVLKDEENIHALQSFFGLGDRFPEKASLLRQMIEEDEDALIVELREPCDEAPTDLVRRWAEEYGRL